MCRAVLSYRVHKFVASFVIYALMYADELKHVNKDPPIEMQMQGKDKIFHCFVMHNSISFKSIRFIASSETRDRHLGQEEVKTGKFTLKSETYLF